MPRNVVMVELGAYWAFYSMWFHLAVENPTCFLLEPENLSLELGRENFRLNSMEGSFHRAYVGCAPGTATDGIRITTVDEILLKNSVEFAHILHSDIQGAELDMLRGASKAISEKRIGYFSFQPIPMNFTTNVESSWNPAGSRFLPQQILTRAIHMTGFWWRKLPT